jgi:hypothetical protein
MQKTKIPLDTEFLNEFQIERIWLRLFQKRAVVLFDIYVFIFQ